MAAKLTRAAFSRACHVLIALQWRFPLCAPTCREECVTASWPSGPARSLSETVFGSPWARLTSADVAVPGYGKRALPRV